MKALLIDPKAQSVSQVDYDGNYQSIYKLIGASPFDVVRLMDGHAMYIDDEGLFREEQHYFLFKGHGPYTNKALIVGTTIDGADVTPHMTTEQVLTMLEFPKLKLTGWTDTEENENVDMPWGGKGFQIISPRPIFEEVT